MGRRLGSAARRPVELEWALLHVARNKDFSAIGRARRGSTLVCRFGKIALARREIAARPKVSPRSEVGTRRRSIPARLATTGKTVIEPALALVAESFAHGSAIARAEAAFTATCRTELAIARSALPSATAIARAEARVGPGIGKPLLRLHS